jgi:hypothetical protein
MQRLFLITALLFSLFAGGQAEARKKEPVDTYERVTDWVPVQKSMSELLNEGWKIVGFNDYQTEMFSDNITSHAFVLANGNKYVICFLIDPAMNDAKSKCRALN